MNRFLKERGFKTYYEYINDLAKRKGFKNYNDYYAKKAGFKDANEYIKDRRYKRNANLPMSVNKNCPSYLGCYISENILPKLFDDPELMLYGNSGYDAICKLGNKVDVKSSCIRKDNCWYFNINKNKISDYFLLIAFNDRENLNIEHMWLISGTEIIRNRKLNDFFTFVITNDEKLMGDFKKYELSEDKLNKIREVCNKFKTEE